MKEPPGKQYEGVPDGLGDQHLGLREFANEMHKNWWDFQHHRYEDDRDRGRDKSAWVKLTKTELEDMHTNIRLDTRMSQVSFASRNG